MTSTIGPDGTVPLWLNGQQVQTSKTFEIISPATSKPLYKSAAASVDDANAAVAAAEAAFPAWAKTKPSARRDILLKAADLFIERKEQFWQLANTEVAAPENYFAFDFQ
jgi:acyl-CoA reductase-like NAD-dependent aldehyde dehydrogenase